MSILSKLERKFGKYAIPNLMYYIVILYAAGMVIRMFAPQVYIQYLMLDASAILRGQIWRVITFLMWPSSGDPFINVLVIYCYFNLGRNLEYVWGSFRFNLYFFMGVLGHVLAAVVIYLLFDGAYFAYGLIFGGAATRIAIVMSLLNFILYFAMSKGGKYNPKEIKRKQQFKTQMNQAVKSAKANGRHRCAVCGRTDLDDPNLVFRYCSKCEGDYEYCQDHLYTHQHVTRGGMDPRQAERNG